MTDETRTGHGTPEPEGGNGGGAEQESRDGPRPKDDELYTPQGGGGGTGSGPIGEVPAVESAPKTGPKGDLREDVLRPGKIPLPQVADRLAMRTGEPSPGGSVTRESGEPDVGGGEEEVSPLRLLMTLAVAGALAGALLVFVFLWSQPRILAYNARVLREAVQEVLKGPDHFESLFLLDGALVTPAQIPESVDTLDLDRVFLGYDEAGRPIGYAMEAEGFGFQDIISLIFGFDAETGRVLGMKVLRHLETPGLGDKIVKDSAFVGEFDGVNAPIEGVKPDRNTGDPDQVDMITGATISSKAVIRIINDRIAALGDLLEAYQPATSAPVDVPATASPSLPLPEGGGEGSAPGDPGGE